MEVGLSFWIKSSSAENMSSIQRCKYFSTSTVYVRLEFHFWSEGHTSFYLQCHRQLGHHPESMVSCILHYTHFSQSVRKSCKSDWFIQLIQDQFNMFHSNVLWSTYLTVTDVVISVMISLLATSTKPHQMLFSWLTDGLSGTSGELVCDLVLFCSFWSGLNLCQSLVFLYVYV